MHAFITKENINALIRQYTSVEDIGLLSIDIDGCDYWILKEINTIRPRILICEFNNAFGAEHPVSVPYSSAFFRRKAHYSDLYFGASLKAIYNAAVSKGYDLVGINSAGMNAFFVRKDLSPFFRTFEPEEVYFPSKIRESKDASCRLSFLSGIDRLREMSGMPLVHTETGVITTIKELYRL